MYIPNNNQNQNNFTGHETRHSRIKPSMKPDKPRSVTQYKFGERLTPDNCFYISEKLSDDERVECVKQLSPQQLRDYKSSVMNKGKIYD
jgi:hypothetical protein